MLDIAMIYSELQGLTAENERDRDPLKLATLIGQLEEAKALAWARLMVLPPRQATVENLLDAEGLAPIIGLPAWAVRDRARRGMFPCVRIGRLMKFRASAVLEALDACRSGTDSGTVTRKRERPAQARLT